MRVMKFGGTSLGCPEGIQASADRIEEAWKGGESVVVVASALSGITSALEKMTADIALPGRVSGSEGWEEGEGSGGDPELLRKRHMELWDALRALGEAESARVEDAVLRSRMEGLFQELRTLCSAALARGSWTPAARDRALATGETLSSHLLAAVLRLRGLPARQVDSGSLIRTDSTFGAARVDPARTEDQILEKLGGPGRTWLPVVPGFSGADTRGRTTTLGRGTSDYTASLLAGALDARLVEIWTDVDGVYSQDPRRFPDPELLGRLDYGEARSLAAAGAKVLHPGALDPVEEKAIPLRVRNTFRPDAAGTLVARRDLQAPGVVLECGGRRVHLLLAGATGGVGRAFLAQLGAVAPRLEGEGLDLRVALLASSRHHVWLSGGSPPDRLPELTGLEEGEPPDWNAILDTVVEGTHRNPLLVDCTASPEVAEVYFPFLQAGIPVVTPNKLAMSGAFSAYRLLRAVSREGPTPFRYETTVGAALPVLGTVRSLGETGDRIRRIEGVLSGTLSFVFNRLARGVPFSQAVRDARDRGFTEPHPGEDLSGADVGRKLLILCREAGFVLEPEAVRVESLVPGALVGERDPDAFLQALRDHDHEWEARAASTGGRRLVYIARMDEEGAEVAVRVVDPADPFATLREAENLVTVESDRYREVPLTIAGPGAGRELTASGVLSDVLAVVAAGYPGSGPGARKGDSPGGAPWGRRVA